MSGDDYHKRLALMMATTPALAAEGWRELDSAPHDGTEVEIRVVNYLAAAHADSHDAIQEGFIAHERAHWIDFNRGGFTWYGLAGSPTHWRPLINNQREGQGR